MIDANNGNRENKNASKQVLPQVSIEPLIVEDLLHINQKKSVTKYYSQETN